MIQMELGVLVTPIVTLSVLLTVVGYRRIVDRPPSNLAKRLWFHLTFAVFAVHAVVVGDFWGLFDQAYVGYEPLTRGLSLAGALVVLYYARVYGWTGTDDETAATGAEGTARLRS